MSVVEMIRPGYGFLAGSSGFFWSIEIRISHRYQVRRRRIGITDRRADPSCSSTWITNSSQSPESRYLPQLYDAQGRLVDNIEIPGSSTDRASFSVDRLPGGVYIVVEQGSGTYGSFVKN